MEQELENGNLAEQQVQRALTDPSVAPLSTIFKVEELEKLNYIKILIIKFSKIPPPSNMTPPHHQPPPPHHQPPNIY